MKVLSLFDGMSCGQIALKQLGVIPERYYASEIDKHAIKQTQLNFPDTIQLGDVIKWKEWNIDWKSINLLLAGSPCQGFSFAGKHLAFDDPRSKLFFVFIDILNHIKSLNPDIMFLLENVNMKKEHMRIISEYCGMFPVNINSNLVSAQNRDRWYWSNIRIKQVGLFGEVYSDIPQPKDKKIFLRDILEKDADEKYYISSSTLNRLLSPHKCFTTNINPDKTGCLDTVNNSSKMRFDSGTTFISVDGKAPTQRSVAERSLDKKHNYQFICVAMRGREACLTPKRTNYGKAIRKDYEAGKLREKRVNIQKLEPRHDGKTNCLTSVDKDNLIIQLKSINSRVSGISFHSEGIRPYRNDLKKSGISEIGTIGLPNTKSCAIICAHEPKIYQNNIRRLTPTECSRLQTVPDWYIWKCSDTRIYKMLGNGWTVDVIVHILSFMKEN